MKVFLMSNQSATLTSFPLSLKMEGFMNWMDSRSAQLTTANVLNKNSWPEALPKFVSLWIGTLITLTFR